MNFLLTPILYYVVDKYSIYHPHIENQYIFTYSPQSPYGTGCCYHPAPHLDRNCLDLFIIICLAIAVITFSTSPHDDYGRTPCGMYIQQRCGSLFRMTCILWKLYRLLHLLLCIQIVVSGRLPIWL